MKHVKTFGGREKEEGREMYVKEKRRDKRETGEESRGNKATRKELQNFPSKRACMTNTNFPQP